MLRSDWRIYRGGALYIEGAEDLVIEDCFFDQLGGNAIFMSGYNRRVHVRGCRIEEAGASGVCFVGRPKAVRNAVTWPQKLSFDAIDLTQGPSSEAYPKGCSVEDTLVVATGRVEKQSAPVEISMSQSITVSHCSLYGVPRAGINIVDIALSPSRDGSQGVVALWVRGEEQAQRAIGLIAALGIPVAAV